MLSPYLEGRDRRAAATVDTYFANSRAVAGRIAREYGIRPESSRRRSPSSRGPSREAVGGLEPGFRLSVSRSRGYKNGSLVAEAVESLPRAAGRRPRSVRGAVVAPVHRHIAVTDA